MYKEVGKRPADLLIHGITSDFDRIAVDFSITEVDSNGALAAGSAEAPRVSRVAALIAEQTKFKDHEKQLVDHGFALPLTSLINFHLSLQPLVLGVEKLWYCGSA